MHSSGPIGYGISIDHWQGYFNFKNILETSAPYDREAVVKAFHWLKKNNPLYQQFLAQVDSFLGIIEADPLAGVANAHFQGIINDLTSLDNAGVQRCRTASDEDLNLLCKS